MFERWNLTVCSVTQSFRAISAFEGPSAASRRISTSRRVSTSPFAACGGCWAAAGAGRRGDGRKIELLNATIADGERQLRDIAARIAAAQNQQNLAFADQSLSLTEKLLISTNSNATINAAEQRRGEVLQELNIARGLLAQSEHVELSRVVQPAAAVRTSATSPEGLGGGSRH